MESSVNPKPHLDMCLFRADMDIARALPNRLRKDRVCESNYRRAFGHIKQGTHLNVVGAGGRLGFGFLRILHRLHIFQGSANTGLGSVNTADELIPFLFRADNRFHFRIREHFNRIQGIYVHGIEHGNGEEKPRFF